MVTANQIRITNVGNDKQEVSLSDIMKGLDLEDKSIKYNFESGTKAEDLDNDFFSINISSTDVFRAVDKFVNPNLEIKDFRSKFTNHKIDIPARGKQSEIKLMLNPISHVVLRLIYQKK